MNSKYYNKYIKYKKKYIEIKKILGSGKFPRDAIKKKIKIKNYINPNKEKEILQLKIKKLQKRKRKNYRENNEYLEFKKNPRFYKIQLYTDYVKQMFDKHGDNFINGKGIQTDTYMLIIAIIKADIAGLEKALQQVDVINEQQYKIIYAELLDMQHDIYHPEQGLLYWNTSEYKEQSIRLINEIQEYIKNPSKNLSDSKNLSYHIQLRNNNKKDYLMRKIEENKKLVDTLQIDYKEYKEFLEHPYFHKIPKEEPNPDTYFERQNEEIEKEIESYQVEINKLDIIIRRNQISSKIKQLQNQLDYNI